MAFLFGTDSVVQKFFHYVVYCGFYTALLMWGGFYKASSNVFSVTYFAVV